MAKEWVMRSLMRGAHGNCCGASGTGNSVKVWMDAAPEIAAGTLDELGNVTG